MWSPTEGCIFSLKVGNSRMIASMISIVLVPGWRWMARRTVRDPLYQAAALSSCTRTAYFWAPRTWTWATPLTVEIFCDERLRVLVDLVERELRRGQAHIED